MILLRVLTRILRCNDNENYIHEKGNGYGSDGEVKGGDHHYNGNDDCDDNIILFIQMVFSSFLVSVISAVPITSKNNDNIILSHFS